VALFAQEPAEPHVDHCQLETRGIVVAVLAAQNGPQCIAVEQHDGFATLPQALRQLARERSFTGPG